MHQIYSVDESRHAHRQYTQTVLEEVLIQKQEKHIFVAHEVLSENQEPYLEHDLSNTQQPKQHDPTND